MEPTAEPIRGGYSCHGPMELAVAEEMDAVTQILLNTVKLYAGR